MLGAACLCSLSQDITSDARLVHDMMPVESMLALFSFEGGFERACVHV